MPLKPGANPYKILELEKGCTDKEIQKAYRAQCLKWHPDKNLSNKEEAERRFIEAKEAFVFLYDKEKRAEYDKGVEKVRVAEEMHRQRMEKTDAMRRKFIEELEKREQAFTSGKRPADSPIPMTPHQQAKKKKAAEDKMREEMESIRKQLEKEANEEVKRQQNMFNIGRIPRSRYRRPCRNRMAQVVPPNEAGQAQIEFFIGLAFEGEMPLGPIKLQLPHLAAQTAETAWIKYQRKIGKRYYCLIKVTKPRCFDYESHRVIGDLTGIWLFFVKSTEEDARKKIDSYDSFPVNQHDERM